MRLSALAIVAVLGSGCIVSANDGPGVGAGSVNLYWEFVRTRFDGSTVLYDDSLRPPAGTGVCADSLVDQVVVTFPGGGSRSSSCRVAGVQGMGIDGIAPGLRTFTVTGFRDGIPIYRSSVSVTVLDGRVVDGVAQVYGIPDDLDVFAWFYNASGTVLFEDPPICGGTVNVQELDYNLVDDFGTVIASGTTPCSDPPGISFSQLDRDWYTIRLQAFRGATLFFDSCNDPSIRFFHAGNDILTAGWSVALLNATCP